MSTFTLGAPMVATNEACIRQTLAKVSMLLYVEPEFLIEVKEPFHCLETKLGKILLLLRKGKAMRKSGLKSDGAAKRASRTFGQYLHVLLGSVEGVIESLFAEWQSRHVLDLAEFCKEMDWFDSLIATLTRLAGGFQHSATEHAEEKFMFSLDGDIKDQGGGPIVGLEKEVQQVLSVLMTSEMKIVSICGMGGSGKTTLAKQVYNHYAVACHFHCRVWVTLPPEFEAISMMEQIAKQVIVGFEKESSLGLEQLRERLRRFLRFGRYLIVLDDMRTPQAWYALRELLPGPGASSGIRILITSRDKDLLLDCSASIFVHEMQVFSDEEGFELLIAKLGCSVPPELKLLGRKIVEKCMGLPLAISGVGDLLSKKAATQEQWSIVLQQINSDQLSLYHALHKSADELPLNLKQCLFYFRLFSQEYDIPARRLIILWVAEGLLQQERGDQETPESVAEKLLTEFVNKKVIQVAQWKLNGKVKSCRLNHLLRDKWLSQADGADFLHHSVASSSSSNSLSHGTIGKILRLADHLDKDDHCFSHIHAKDTINTSFRRYYRDLRSFLSFDSREGPDPGEDLGNFLRRGIAKGCFKMLRVIDLEDVFQPKLPKSIAQLVELRYLGLRGTYLGMLPSSIGNLLNLQTLDLKNTKISTLPTSLWKMQQLRHLYLSGSYRCRFVPPPSTTSSLVDLQTLWGAFIDEECPIEDGLDRLINLRKLRLVCQLTLSQQKALAEWISKLNHLKSLSLRLIDEMVQPSNLYLEPLSNLKNLSSIYLFGRLENPIVVDCFPESLTQITLSLSGLAEDPMHRLEKLPNLRILSLFSRSYTGKIMVCSLGGFPLLRVLNLWKLQELEEWIVEKGALPILREVEIRSCNKLKMVPEGFEHLVHCRELKLTKMPHEFTARITENQGPDWFKVAHVPTIVVKD